jgi:hypothetical protein
MVKRRFVQGATLHGLRIVGRFLLKTSASDRTVEHATRRL